jgi:hypothetical protein
MTFKSWWHYQKSEFWRKMRTPGSAWNKFCGRRERENFRIYCHHQSAALSRSNHSRIEPEGQDHNQEPATADQSNGNTKARPMQKGSG